MKTLGWIAVWALFIVFHWLYFTNQITALLWLTLFSVGPIWALTAIGGTIEIRELLGRFNDSQGEG